MARQKPRIDGRKVRKLREEQGLTINQLADQTIKRARVEGKKGVTAKTIYRMEHSEAVSLYTLYWVADALGVRPAELFIEEQASERPAPFAGRASASAEQGQVGKVNSQDRMPRLVSDILPPENQSTLIDDVLSYLKHLADECEDLPPYFPAHLRISGFGKAPFDKLWPTVRVITDRSQLDQWLAQERKRLAREGLVDPDSIVYGPRRSMPEEEAEHDKKPEIEILDWDEHTSRRFKRAVILGDPGSGKTWLLKHEAKRLALEADKKLRAGKSLDDVVLPIFCRLSDLACSKGALQEAISNLFTEKHSEVFCCLVHRRLDTNKCVLLLDAWDEVSEKLPLQKRIEAFARDFRHPGIILTSRIVGYETTRPPLLGAKELEIIAFDWPKIKAFVQVWFGQETQRGKKLLATLAKNRQVKGLARIPLMLGLICRLCPDGDFPLRRSELYEACLKGLLRDWVEKDESATQTEIAQAIRNNPDVLEAILDLLGHVSLGLFRKSYEQFTITQLRPLISEFIRGLDDWHELSPRNTRIHLSDLIALLKAQGVFVAANSSADPPLLFLHRTFQEYLVGRATAREPDAITTALRHAYDPGWHEVLVLLGGLLGDRTNTYIASLLRENQNDLLCRPLFLSVEATAEAGRDLLPRNLFRDLAQEIVNMCLGTDSVFLWKRAVLVLRCLPESCEHLVALIKSKNNRQHSMAVTALENLRSDQAIEALVQATKDEDFSSVFAVEALGRIGSERAVEVLLQIVKNIDRRSLAAIWALGQTGSEQAVETLVEALNGKDHHVCITAAEALGEIGSEKAVKALIQTLKNRDRKWLRRKFAPDLRVQDNWMTSALRCNAALALGQTGSEQAVEVLVEALRDEDESVCYAATEALGQIGSEQALKALVKTLKNAAKTPGLPLLCINLVESVAKIGSEQAVEALIEALKSRHAAVRRRIAEILGQIGSEQAIEALILALKDDNGIVLYNAAKALGQIGSKEVVDALTKALKDKNAQVRVWAAEILRRIGPEPDLETFARKLNDKDFYIRSEVVQTLGQIGSEQAVKILISTLKDESHWVRSAAAEALGRVGSEQALKALIGALTDKHEFVRREAAQALGHIGSKHATDALISVLNDVDTTTINCASEAILRICDRRPVPVSNCFLSSEMRNRHCLLAKSLESLAQLLESEADPKG